MKKELGVHIVVLQRGWVVIGHLSSVGNQYEVRKGSVIRSWGTTKGLGELVKSGPLSNTKLDPTNGVIRFHKLTTVLRIKCPEDIWLKHLS